ncbi:mannitol-1-phosphate 5-dehydrogenase [Enterococcus avium]|uniref:mannitol-1-phosphate 5-dehydrogenase n=1 Tax=Enterococcus malodoratus TaxID=71451 RepID=UPI0008CD1A99|nr:mannitol-1-phosphate 5-dehydrogenase [Enterococcus malodoratus]BBM18849.1 mannitol-1-phosphate 5-dehydrogenase [Enterococcus avium]SET61954.1 mannitol-1-phosphate 5-dehydrogenase [Enterococcus malodoratus]
MKALHFGAGNIGRGFIGDLLHKSGYEITFVEVTDKVVRQLNRDKNYDLYILNEDNRKVVIDNIQAVSSITDEQKVIEAICEADLVTTSVWADNLPKIADVLAKGLHVRHNRGLNPVNVIACENALFASNILKELLLKHISEEVLIEIAQFANTSVDRLALGKVVDGKSCVEIDSAFELVIEENPLFRKEPIKGATYVEELQPYLERKLYIVNCGHAALAYLGFVKGYPTVQEALKDEEIKTTAISAMNESSKLLEAKYGFTTVELQKKVEESIERFSATFVMDDVLRVGRSPLRKLDPTDRLVAPAAQLEAKGLPNDSLAKCIAALLRFENPADEQAVELKQEVDSKGVEAALNRFSKIDKESPLFKKIIEEYKKG